MYLPHKAAWFFHAAFSIVCLIASGSLAGRMRWEGSLYGEKEICYCTRRERNSNDDVIHKGERMEDDSSLPQNWESYFCHVEDKFASMRLNLGLAQVAPMAELPYCGVVSVTLQAPRENGMPEATEADVLYDIEDALQDELAQDDYALFAGCCTANGLRHFYFYGREESPWQHRISTAMQGFADYTYETAIYQDESWMGYFDFLYPTKPDLHFMYNSKLLQEVEQNGCALDIARRIEYTFRVYDEGKVTALTEKLTAMGFSVERVQAAADAEATQSADETAFDSTVIEFVRHDKPCEADDITMSLLALEEEYDAEYLGWGTLCE